MAVWVCTGVYDGSGYTVVLPAQNRIRSNSLLCDDSFFLPIDEEIAPRVVRTFSMVLYVVCVTAVRTDHDRDIAQENALLAMTRVL